MRRWRQIAANWRDRRLNSRKFQEELDWFRFAVLARLHERGVSGSSLEQRDAITDELTQVSPTEHRNIVRNYYVAELNRLCCALHDRTNGEGCVQRMRLPRTLRSSCWLFNTLSRFLYKYPWVFFVRLMICSIICFFRVLSCGALVQKRA